MHVPPLSSGTRELFPSSIGSSIQKGPRGPESDLLCSRHVPRVWPNVAPRMELRAVLNDGTNRERRSEWVLQEPHKQRATIYFGPGQWLSVLRLKDDWALALGPPPRPVATELGERGLLRHVLSLSSGQKSEARVGEGRRSPPSSGSKGGFPCLSQLLRAPRVRGLGVAPPPPLPPSSHGLSRPQCLLTPVLTHD